MKKLLWILCVIVGLPVMAQDPDAAGKLVEQGVDLHDNGDYNGAVAKYREALKLDSVNLVAMGEIAYSLHMLNKDEESVFWCKKAIAMYPDSSNTGWIYITLGNSLDGLDRGDEAIQVYNEGIKKFPNENMLHFNKGVALSMKGQFTEALTSMEISAKCNPRHPGTQNAMGYLLMGKKRIIPALMTFLRFMILEPTGKRAEDNLSLIMDLMGAHVEKTGKNDITIYFDPKNAGDNGDSTSNNFSLVEMTLSLATALDFDKKYKKETAAERMIRKLDLMFSMLKNEDQREGFYWEFYAPYFYALKEAGHVETLAYIVLASSKDAEVGKWLSGHKDEIDKFYEWSSNFDWNK